MLVPLLKQLAIGLLGAVLTFCLLTTAVLTAANTVFGKPDTLKQSLAESGVYKSASSAFQDQAISELQDPDPGGGVAQTGRFTADEQTTRQIAEQVITEQKVQGYIEQIIDGTYKWLEGETPQPDFAIHPEDAQRDLSNAAGDAAVSRFESLPGCTLAELQQINPTDVNPFELSCKPPGISRDAIRQRVANEVNGYENALGRETFTVDSLGQGGQNVFESMDAVPVIFQWSRQGPWIPAVAALAAAAAIILWSTDRNRGMQKVSIKTLLCGILLFVGLGISVLALNFINPAGRAGATPIESVAYDLVLSLGTAFNRVLLYFASAYAVLGTAGILFTRSKLARNPSTPPKRLN